MLDKSECLEYRERYMAELDLTNRRLERLLAKQEINPTFQAYDVYAGEMVGLDIRIEEQAAVKDELEWYLELIEDQIQTLKLKEENPNCKIIKQGVAQLSLIDC